MAVNPVSPPCQPLAPHTGFARRNHTLDLFRILLALCVLLSHAPELTDGNKSRELLSRATHTTITLGSLGVDGFFLLSGFLIVQSWKAEPRFAAFFRKRFLRIVPGYLVAALLSTAIVGMLAPGVSHWFTKFGRPFPLSLLALSYPYTPSVLPGLAYPSVNGALWTINYEFRCYMIVAFLGMAGLFRRPKLFLALAGVAYAGFLLPKVGRLHFPMRWTLLVGDPFQQCRLTAAYLTGAGFHLFRSRIVFRPRFAFLAATMLLVIPALAPALFEPALVLCGGYLLFYAGQAEISGLTRLYRLPDVSYGLYLYGWPVESLLIWYHRGSPWLTFAEAAPLSLILGWLSWRWIERPALRLKGRSSAPLPAP